MCISPLSANRRKLEYLHSLSSLAVLPWALESWAEYDIKVFAKEGDLEKYANSEHALCVLNHRGDLDWMIGWVLIERMGMLGVSLIDLTSTLCNSHLSAFRVPKQS